MRGFFKADVEDIKKHSKPIKEKTNTKRTVREKKQTVSKICDCNMCGLDKTCISPHMKYSGKGKLEILIIAEAPGKTEDEKNTQLVGEAGDLFRDVLKSLGADLDRDFWKTNAVTCFISPKISVYTSKGYKQIKDVEVGDLVLTHKGRFKKVLSKVHDLPLEKRKNKEKLVCIKTKFRDYVVTETHKFLLPNGKWIKANHLCAGDKIKALGEKCVICGNVYFKNPQVFDKAESTCSQKCHNIAVSKKSGAAISRSLKSQFESGMRDRNKITREANKKYKQLIKTGWRSHDYVDPENLKKGRQSASKKKESFNTLYKGITVGRGEKELSKWLINEKVDFYHQYSIGGKNFDFYIPDFNLLIEVENPVTYKCNKKIKDVRYIERKKIAKENDFDLVFVSSDDCINEIKRVLKNHLGDYVFTETEVLGVRVYKQKRQEYLYCIEVEEDNSFVSGGIVSHNCRPPNNRKPTRRELKCCKINIEKTISELKPKFIWLMGGAAVESFFMERFSDLSINLWRRRLIPDHEHNCCVIPLFHPSYVLRNQDDKLSITFKNDIKWALSCLGKKISHPLKLDVEVLNDNANIISLLKDILRLKQEIIFDYETSSINSHLPNPKIWTIGVNKCSFGLDHPEVKYDIQEIEKLWGDILRDDKIKKVAHNLKFEDAWSRARFGQAPQGWVHDTMISQHIVEHRPTHVGLKYQSFVKWGIPDYEQETKRYLSDGDRGTNKLDQMPLVNLCRYNAIDTLLTEKLWQCQNKELERNKSLRDANDLFFKGTLTFCDVESEGICIDDHWYKSRQTELGKEIEKIETELINGKEGKRFKKEIGRELKIGSNKDLITLFFDILKLNSTKKTISGNPSVDVEALSELRLPFVKELLRYRKMIKIKDTYLAQFLREEVNSKIYPSFLLHTVDTYRSSCVSPNFQNIPIRDEEASRETRSGVIPSRGNKLLEADYSSMEVRICACYTKDPALIEYINDPKSDMHKDQAKLLFMLDDDNMTKDIRFHTKNGFVFPEIYGSYYMTCATNLWEEAKHLQTNTGVPLIKHLRECEIENLDDFISHVKNVENDFWNKFPLIKEWKENTEDFYKRKGYIQFLFGHRRSGYLTRNMLSNYPIQGAAFHCLLWSVIRLNEIRKKEKWKTKLVGQIHDSVVFDLCPEEEKHVIETTRQVMTKDIREKFDFLIVPLEVEAEITDINKSWYTKHKIRE